jgi:hypothetical protein
MVGVVLGIALLSGLLRAGLEWDLLSRVHLFPACPILATTGVPCPGCGMTRAFLLLGQLRLEEALSANPAAPLLALVMTGWALRPWRLSQRVASRLAGALLIAVIALWIVWLADL